MKLAITGAGGFLGRELLRELADNSDTIVYAFTTQRQKTESDYPFENIKVTDVSEYKKFDFSRIDVLINCAFPTGAEDEQLANGLRFLSDILEAAASRSVGAVVNISSQSVYGFGRSEGACESDPLAPDSKYAVAKYTAELLTSSICKNIPHTSIRLASLIGAGFDKRFVNKFVKKAVCGEEITVKGGSQRFGFLDVRDAAGGILSLAEKNPGQWRPVYNLGPNGSYTLLEIARAVCDLGAEAGYPPCKINVEEGGAMQNTELDCRLFYSDFNWHPRYMLTDTIKAIFASEGSGTK